MRLFKWFLNTVNKVKLSWYWDITQVVMVRNWTLIPRDSDFRKCIHLIEIWNPKYSHDFTGLLNVGKNTFEVCFRFFATTATAALLNALRFLARYWWKCGNGITWEERTILQLQKIHSRVYFSTALQKVCFAVVTASLKVIKKILAFFDNLRSSSITYNEKR